MPYFQPCSHRLSQELRRLAEESQKDQMTLGDLLTRVGIRAQVLIILLFSLPFLVLISLPGISTVFGLVIFLLGFRFAVHKGIWLPNRFLAYHIGGRRFYQTFLMACKIVGWMEKFTRPRWAWFFSSPLLQVVHGIMLALGGLFLALPLPPGTNFPPAICSVVLSMGLLEHDGLWIVIGYLLFILNLAFFIFLAWFGIDGIKRIF